MIWITDENGTLRNGTETPEPQPGTRMGWTGNRQLAQWCTLVKLVYSDGTQNKYMPKGWYARVLHDHDPRYSIPSEDKAFDEGTIALEDLWVLKDQSTEWAPEYRARLNG